MQKKMISSPSLISGLKTASARSSDTAAVLGVVLCASAHSKILSGVTSSPSLKDSSPIIMFNGTIVILYFCTNSCDKSHVLSANILILIIDNIPQILLFCHNGNYLCKNIIVLQLFLHMTKLRFLRRYHRDKEQLPY